MIPVSTYCNLDLPVAKFKVKLEGYGGWTIKDMRTWLPSVSRDKPVDMVYVEMGSNDLCQSDDPRLVAKHLVAFADYLCESQGIKSVYLGQCHRRFQSKDNTKYALVVIFNRELCFVVIQWNPLKYTTGDTVGVSGVQVLVG